MFVDEHYFHKKRGLPPWEKIGHPIDTLFLLFCFIVALRTDLNQWTLALFIGLALFSCILITKDEFIHSEQCSPAENWLHSLLFVLHPIVLFSVAIQWGIKSGKPLFFTGHVSIAEINLVSWFLVVQTVFIFSFMIYQIVYWNILSQKKVVENNAEEK